MKKRRFMYLIPICIIAVFLIEAIVVISRNSHDYDYNPEVVDYALKFEKYLTVDHPTKLIWVGDVLEFEYDVNLDITYADHLTADVLAIRDDESFVFVIINDFDGTKDLTDEEWDRIFTLYETDNKFGICYLGQRAFTRLADRVYGDEKHFLEESTRCYDFNCLHKFNEPYLLFGSISSIPYEKIPEMKYHFDGVIDQLQTMYHDYR